MNVPVELSLALRYLRPRRTFVSIITLLSFAGVALAVAVLIIVLSVMTGFREVFEQKMIGFNAHITVSSDGLITDPDQLVTLIEKQPGVLAAEGVVRGPVEVEVTNGGDSRLTVAYITSGPENGDDPVLPLKKYLTMGEYELRGDSAIVGREWSRRNSVFPGDQVVIYGPAVLQSIQRQYEAQQNPNHPAARLVVMPDEVTVRGVFQTKHYAYDSDFLLISTALAQHIYGLGTSVQEIAVRVKNLDDVDKVRDEINAVLPEPLVAKTWMDNNIEFLNALATERVMMTIVLSMVVVVAAFGLCSTLITITVQKSREIGLMKALGANDFQVCSVFLLHSLIVGVIGAGVGVGLGLLFLAHLNDVRDFLLKHFGIQVFNPNVYGETDLPTVANPIFVLIVALSAVAMCLLASLLPAANAARLAPARALRYE
jgi:lipoprotein-releasing system permease protein